MIGEADNVPLTIAAGIGSILIGAIGYLYALLNKEFQECKEDRRKLWAALARATGKSVVDLQTESNDVE